MVLSFLIVILAVVATTLTITYQGCIARIKGFKQESAVDNQYDVVNEESAS